MVTLGMPLNGNKKRKYDIFWRNKRRNDFILSKGGICSECSSKENLEVDHIDRNEKKFHPTQIWSRKKEIRDNELKKCQVLCSTCHNKKTQKERGDMKKLVKHGDCNKYRHGCRCRPCKDAIAKYIQEKRKLAR